MKRQLIILFFIYSRLLMAQDNFLQYQFSFPRVQQAKLSFDTSLQQFYLRAFKQEQILEVWATDDVQFKLIKTYKFTAMSGKLGAKKQEGDQQIPEGFLA